MKIIISPSKTQKITHSDYLEEQEILYPKEHKKVLSMLKKLAKEDIKRIMKIDKQLLDDTYSNIKNYNHNPSFKAFFSFNGLVFKGLDKNSYKQEEYTYIKNHLRILDASYGILEPGTMIKKYRLDMKMKIGLNLYTHWNISPYFKEEVIINLASEEFSKLIISSTMINISFLQKKEDKYINQATYSKQARGIFLDYMIKHKIKDINELMTFNKEQYLYNIELSNETTLVFTR